MNPEQNGYNLKFYDAIEGGSRRSAEVIVPLVIELLHPQSVIDIGCGTGLWLAEFARQGVRTYIGVDGAHVDPLRLSFSSDRFIAANLAETKELPGSYDLAISLEVAEHLPEASAEQFIGLITKLAPAVLFSAAIPGQGGVGHVNEKWQDYWRQIFHSRGFVPVDVIRPIIFGHSAIEPWYQQNMILYVDPEKSGFEVDSTVSREDRSLNLVHPWTYRQRIEREQTLRSCLRNLPAAFGQALRSRTRRNADPPSDG